MSSNDTTMPVPPLPGRVTTSETPTLCAHIKSVTISNPSKHVTGKFFFTISVDGKRCFTSPVEQQDTTPPGKLKWDIPKHVTLSARSSASVTVKVYRWWLLHYIYFGAGLFEVKKELYQLVCPNEADSKSNEFRATIALEKYGINYEFMITTQGATNDESTGVQLEQHADSLSKSLRNIKLEGGHPIMETKLVLECLCATTVRHTEMHAQCKTALVVLISVCEQVASMTVRMRHTPAFGDGVFILICGIRDALLYAIRNIIMLEKQPPPIQKVTTETLSTIKYLIQFIAEVSAWLDRYYISGAPITDGDGNKVVDCLEDYRKRIVAFRSTLLAILLASQFKIAQSSKLGPEGLELQIAVVFSKCMAHCYNFEPEVADANLLRLPLTLQTGDGPHAHRLTKSHTEDLLYAFLEILLNKRNLPYYRLTDPFLRSRLRRNVILIAQRLEILPDSIFLTGVEYDPQDLAVAGGGFGDIYRCSFGERVVAVKVPRFPGLQPALVNQTIQASRREILIGITLSHPHVLPFLGVHLWSYRDGTSVPCTVTPWMEHGNLSEKLKSMLQAAEWGRDYQTHLDITSLVWDASQQFVTGLTQSIPGTRSGRSTHAEPQENKHPLSNTISRWVSEIADGLDYLHGENVVHGDLRSPNILLDDNDHVLLCDFGLSTFVHTLSSTVFQSQREVGNCRWMAPELLRPSIDSPDAGRPTFASDIYSFGRVCLELHTGQSPFHEAQHRSEIERNVMDGIAPKRPRARDGDLADMDDPLWNLVNNCWVRDPGNRPSSGTVLNTLLSSGRHITYRLRDEVTINTPESLLLAMGEGLSDICTCLSNDSDLRITLVQKTEAQLLICLEQRRVVFRILIVEPEFRIFFTIGNIAEEVINVVRAAAHYFFHLSCMPGSLALHQTIDVEAFRLVESEQAEEDLWFTRLLPQGGNMIHSKSGTSNMDLFVDDHAFYGFRITNNGDLPIYCNLFFFDSDFEIIWYNKPEGPLPVQPNAHSLYDAQMRFELRDEEMDVDLSFLKVFISTEPIDLSHIPQSSPFCQSGVWDEIRLPADSYMPSAKCDVKTITIHQRRGTSAGDWAGSRV